MIQMRLCGREQFVIFDIPNVAICPAGNIGDELPESPFWVTPMKFRKSLNEFMAEWRSHGIVSILSPPSPFRETAE